MNSCQRQTWLPSVNSDVHGSFNRNSGKELKGLGKHVFLKHTSYPKTHTTKQGTRNSVTAFSNITAARMSTKNTWPRADTQNTGNLLGLSMVLHSSKAYIHILRRSPAIKRRSPNIQVPGVKFMRLQNPSHEHRLAHADLRYHTKTQEPSCPSSMIGVSTRNLSVKFSRLRNFMEFLFPSLHAWKSVCTF